jgi:hypothetical protein
MVTFLGCMPFVHSERKNFADRKIFRQNHKCNLRAIDLDVCESSAIYPAKADVVLIATSLPKQPFTPMSHPRNLSISALLFILTLPLAHAGEAVVTWPSLKKLDDLAEKCEALTESKDVAALRKIAASVKTAAEKVETEAVPKNAKQPEQVKVFQGDLKNLTDSITEPAKQDGEELTALLAGVHPIVEQLMEASGMPHVHETEEPKSK